MGARDMSIINTPPPNRQPVHTPKSTVSMRDLIRDAILQEVIARRTDFLHQQPGDKTYEVIAEMIRSTSCTEYPGSELHTGRCPDQPA
jgi:transcription-repair coupling factor (superfamily II helicase)